MNHVETQEAMATIESILAALSFSVPGKVGPEGSDYRRQAGDILAYGEKMIIDGTLGRYMIGCFNLARHAGSSFYSLNRARLTVMELAPVHPAGVNLVALAVRNFLVQQSLIVAGVEFKSRDAVDKVLDILTVAFDGAEEFAADRLETFVYTSLIKLHANVVYDLTTRARLLPRIVHYEFGKSQPSLRLANLLYADAKRNDDIVSENRTPHPAFMPVNIKALSA